MLAGKNGKELYVSCSFISNFNLLSSDLFAMFYHSVCNHELFNVPYTFAYEI